MGHLQIPTNILREELELPADLFSRATLEQTFQVIRHACPSLALSLQNILAGQCKQDSPLQNAPKRTDYQYLCEHNHIEASDLFMIKLDATTIGQIVFHLTLIGQDALNRRAQKQHTEQHQEQQQEQEQLKELRFLIKKWSLLGEWLIQKNLQLHFNMRQNSYKNPVRMWSKT